MPVVATVTMVMIVMMVMAVCVCMIVVLMLACGYVVVVTMYGSIVVRVPFGYIGFAVQARVFAEHQRFDRDRNGARWHTDAAQIDVVEPSQRNAIDHEQVNAVQCFAQQVA